MKSLFIKHVILFLGWSLNVNSATTDGYIVFFTSKSTNDSWNIVSLPMPIDIFRPPANIPPKQFGTLSVFWHCMFPDVRLVVEPTKFAPNQNCEQLWPHVDKKIDCNLILTKFLNEIESKNLHLIPTMEMSPAASFSSYKNIFSVVNVNVMLLSENNKIDSDSWIKYSSVCSEALGRVANKEYNISKEKNNAQLFWEVDIPAFFSNEDQALKMVNYLPESGVMVYYIKNKDPINFAKSFCEYFVRPLDFPLYK